jgi:hypothetical protein
MRKFVAIGLAALVAPVVAGFILGGYWTLPAPLQFRDCFG